MPDYVGGGFGRQMSRGKFGGSQESGKLGGSEMPKPKEQEQGQGQSRHATIHKEGPGHFTVEHEHGKSGPHSSFREAAHHAGKAMGEELGEPEGDDIPTENALGMVHEGMMDKGA